MALWAWGLCNFHVTFASSDWDAISTYGLHRAIAVALILPDIPLHRVNVIQRWVVTVNHGNGSPSQRNASRYSFQHSQHGIWYTLFNMDIEIESTTTRVEVGQPFDRIMRCSQQTFCVVPGNNPLMAQVYGALTRSTRQTRASPATGSGTAATTDHLVPFNDSRAVVGVPA